MPEPSILITGGSGVLGTALLRELEGEPVTCLTRRRGVEREDACCVSADLTQPSLGLGEREYRELAASTKAIVHCAARTAFGHRPEAYRATNVEGTKRVLELAERSGAPMIHVSSSFVRRIAVREDATYANQSAVAAGIDAYLNSKRDTEREVLDSTLPVRVVRPSLVLGDTRTGEIAKFQGLHLVAWFVMTNQLPVMPVPRHALIDALPQDLVARMIVQVLRRDTGPRELWLTAGRDAMPVGRMVDHSRALAERLGKPVPPCRWVEPELVERLIRPAFFGDLPSEMRETFEQLISLMSLFYTEEPFPSSLHEPVIADLVPQRMDDVLEESFVRSIEYMAERRGLGEAVAG